MSDYRSNHENNAILYNGVDENSYSPRQLSNRLTLFERGDGISCQDYVFNPCQRSRMDPQQTEMYRPRSPQNDGKNTDVSYIEEVERISLNLIRLLRAARQKRVKTACGMSQRHQLVQRITSPDESDKDLCLPADRPFIQTSLDIPEYTRNVRTEHDYNTTGGIRSFSDKTAPADRLFLLTDSASEAGGAIGTGSCSISLGTTRNDLGMERDRQREIDTYDKIEERGFCKSAELRGQQLQEANDRSQNQKKDSVFNHTLEIIKELRRSHDHVRLLEGKLRERDMQIKKLALRLERLEVFNTCRATDMRGTDVIENKTSLEEPHSDFTLQELRSDTLKMPPQKAARGIARDDSSTTTSDVSTSSSY